MSSTKHTQGPLVVVFPRGQLSAEDKAAMGAAGIVAVEADDTKAVVQLHIAAPLVCASVNGDALVSAAIRSISSAPETDRSEAARTALRFVRLLAQSLDGAKAEGKLTP